PRPPLFPYTPLFRSATVTPDPAAYMPSNPPAVLEFDWTTSCGHVRDQPYQVVFKITDESPAGTNLVTYKTWRIRVIAPAPEWKRSEEHTSELQSREN